MAKIGLRSVAVQRPMHVDAWESADRCAWATDETPLPLGGTVEGPTLAQIQGQSLAEIEATTDNEAARLTGIRGWLAYMIVCFAIHSLIFVGMGMGADTEIMSFGERLVCLLLGILYGVTVYMLLTSERRPHCWSAPPVLCGLVLFLLSTGQVHLPETDRPADSQRSSCRQGSAYRMGWTRAGEQPDPSDTHYTIEPSTSRCHHPLR
jgi:hypothetical protein